MNWPPACFSFAGTLLFAFVLTSLRIALVGFGVRLADRLDLFDVLRARRPFFGRGGTADRQQRQRGDAIQRL